MLYSPLYTGFCYFTLCFISFCSLFSVSRCGSFLFVSSPPYSVLSPPCRSTVVSTVSSGLSPFLPVSALFLFLTCYKPEQSLLHNGVPPGFADDQVGPLHDHNAGEERCVAGELYDLSSLVCLPYTTQQRSLSVTKKINHVREESQESLTDPLLSVAVFQVVDKFVVPKDSDSDKVHGEESVFSQDHKVWEEASCGLHHA